MNYDWFNIDSQNRAEWDALCPPGQYRVIKPENLPGPLPSALTDKFDSLLVLASGATDGTTYFMLNGNRVEHPSNKQPSGAIDQQPFGIAFLGSSSIGSGCLVQHGNWSGRTTTPPSDFWDHVQASGIGQVYPISELPSSPSGRLEDLRVSSQKEAFNTCVIQIRSKFQQN